MPRCAGPGAITHPSLVGLRERAESNDESIKKERKSMIEPRSAMPTGAKVGFAATLMALALVAPGPASAQGAGGGGAPGVLPGGPGSRPQQEVNVPPTPAAPSPYQQTRLFGDWDGIRPMLLDHGVDLQLGLVGEWAANASGERLGAGYAGQVAFSADIDWEKLLGIPGFNTHYVMINRHGNNLSQFAYGDNFMQADEVYGAGFNMGIRFVYLYGEEKLFNDRLNIAIGRLPVAVDFAASPLYCIPVALIGCGNPRALTNNGTFTSWPQSTWGGRIRARPTPEIYVQFGAYKSKPFPGGGRTGWTWSTAGATGVIMPFEIGWEPIFGPNKLVGHYKVGFSYDTSDFNSLAMGRFGAPLLFPTQTPNITNGRTQFWATADQLIVRQGTSENAGITLLANVRKQHVEQFGHVADGVRGYSQQRILVAPPR